LSPTPDIPIAGPVSGVPEHKHCEVCGKAIALDGRICSTACQERAIEAFRQRRRSVYVFVGAIALVLLFTYGSALFKF